MTVNCIISSELSTMYVACGILSEALLVRSDNIGEQSASSIGIAFWFLSKLRPVSVRLTSDVDVS